MSREPDVATALHVPEVSHEELLSRLGDPSLVVVDVLPRVSYEEAHIPGAISLPVAEIPAHARELLPDPGADIVLYCGNPT